MIELKNVTFAYDNDEVLKGITVSVPDGQFCAVVGRNGSGKSTFAKLLNGILLPKNGDVISFGMNTRDESRLFDIRKNVGMVFQNPDNQIVNAIVEDEVAFGAENLCVEPSVIRERVDRALAAVRMTKYKKAQTSNLSGGEKQRIAIASVLAMNPKTIVFDESTAMLDPRGRDEFMELICRLNKEQGIGIILITHYMEEAAKADRMLVLEDGKIINDDTPRNILKNTDTAPGLLQMTKLILELNKAGFDFPSDILSDEEMAEAILREYRK